MYSVAGAAYCSLAEAGTSARIVGGLRVGVDNCTMGTFSMGASDNCTNCVGNQYSLTERASSCHVAPEGWETIRSNTLKTMCPPNTFSPKGESCTPCGANKYSNKGSAACYSCSGGQYYNATEPTPQATSECRLLAADNFKLLVNTTTTCCDYINSITPYILSGADAYQYASTMTCFGEEEEGCAEASHFAIGMATDTGRNVGGRKRFEDGCADLPPLMTTRCASCPAGTFNENGDGTTCAPCDGPGEYSGAGASFCLSAPAGTIPSIDNTTTTPCPINTFSIGASDICSPCRNGHAPVGSASCQTTPIGHYYKQETEEDIPCPPGTFSSGAANITGCMQCEGGFISALGSGFCDVCEAGKISNKNNTLCEDCVTGKYSGVGASICTSCEASKYSSTEGQATCQFCPELQESNTDFTGCVCKDGFVPVDGKCECGPGYTLENGACVMCSAGLFKPSVGNGQCTSCNLKAVVGSFSTTSSIAKASNATSSGPPLSAYNCSCASGEYRALITEEPEIARDAAVDANTHIGKCISCDTIEGVHCDEPGITIRTLAIAKGYWRSNELSTDVEKCYNEEACLQLAENQPTLFQSFNLSSQCREGHRGPICNVCKNGYVASVTGECESCEVNGDAAGFHIPTELLVLLSAVVVIVLLILRRQAQQLRHMDTEEKLMFMRRSKKDSILGAISTKFKILASFFQILSQFENILQIRFPPVFEEFTRWLNSVFNLDALSLVKVGCIVETNFYTRLLVMTITPIALTGIIFLFAWVKQMFFSDEDEKKRIRDRAISLFLVLTYMVFVSVSMTVFFTFGCRSYGGNSERFLFLDQSISCETDKHRWFMYYATVMIFVYPFGITALYFRLLWTHRKALVEEGREKNRKLNKIAFLWDDYEPEMWWFEVFECFRRQMLTGMLVFVSQGSATQIVIAMVLAFLSFGVYLRFTPFIKEEDDVIAISAQVSLFFSLFSSLLIKANIDEEDGYDQYLFGVLMIILNLTAVGVTLLYYFAVPIKKISRALGKKHVHNGELRGLGASEKTREGFVRYFERLCLSSPQEAGWETINPKHFGGKKGEQWMKDTGAVCEWRCSSGDGPVDTCRTRFTIKADVEEVTQLILFGNKRQRTTLQELILGQGNQDSDKLYLAVKTPFPFSNRDFVLERFHELNRSDNSVLSVSRSVSDSNIKSEKESARDRRVRAKMHCGGYMFIPKYDSSECESSTEIIHVASVDLSGAFALDYLSRKASVARLRGVVDSNIKRFGSGMEDEEEEVGRGSSIFDVFSGVKNKIIGGGKNRQMLQGEIEMNPIAASNTKKENEEAKRKARIDQLKKGGYNKSGQLRSPKAPSKAEEAPVSLPTKKTNSWSKVLDEASGHYYYVHNNGLTQWDRPDDYDGPP